MFRYFYCGPEIAIHTTDGIPEYVDLYGGGGSTINGDI